MIKVIKGDITKIKADAVVNPANSHLIMGGGVAGALRRAGGPEVQKEALKKAPVPIGKAVVTTGGKLPSKYVIHAPTMEEPAMRTNTEKVRAACHAALKLAKEMNLKTIVIPPLGTGVGGVNKLDAARVIVDEALKYPNLDIILIDLFDDGVEAFRKALKERGLST